MSDSHLVAPSAVVVADKGYGRLVSLAITDEDRIAAHGFDVEYPALLHFRALRPGRFAVLVGTSLPLEVQVIMDGVLLASQICDPNSSVSKAAAETSVRRNVRELVDKPQAFFIDSGDNGEPLIFKKSVQTGRQTRSQQLREQMFPLLSSKHLPALRLDQPGQSLSEQTDLQALLPPDELPLIWADSTNLIAVAIRMMQVPIEGEPTLPQDVFTYVLFQLNDWDDNAWVRANSHSRIILPPGHYRELDDGTIFVDDPAGCGNVLNLK